MQEAKRGNRHQQFCSILAHLATAERQYMMLGFMLPKGFFQKDVSLRKVSNVLYISSM